MTTMSQTQIKPRSSDKSSWLTKLADGLVSWWMAYATWRIERKAVKELWAMSDRELRDIGLTRSGIPNAVRAHAIRAREFSRNYW